ncbi:MAG: hypothetical protein V3R81_03830 [Gammaproteobacteria bacterium]
MTKQTGTIITAVVAVIILLCCAAPLCSWGISFFTELVDWGDIIGTRVPPALGIIPCCLSILVLLIPAACWFFLARNKGDATGVEVEIEMEMEPEEEFEGTIEDDVSY